MKIIKKQSKATYTSKQGEEKHYYNFYIVLDNGVQILIKPVDKKGESKNYNTLNVVAYYEK